MEPAAGKLMRSRKLLLVLDATLFRKLMLKLIIPVSKTTKELQLQWKMDVDPVQLSPEVKMPQFIVRLIQLIVRLIQFIVRLIQFIVRLIQFI